MSEKNNRRTAAILVEMTLLTVIVILLQFFELKSGHLNTTFCVIPILFGIIISGNIGGAWLGFVFGVSWLFTTGVQEFIRVNVSAGFCACLIVGSIAGAVTSIVYNYLADKKGKTIATFAGAFAWSTLKMVLLLAFYVLFFRAIYFKLGIYNGSKISYLTKNLALTAVLEIVEAIIASPIIVKLAKLNEEKILNKNKKKNSDTNEDNSL